MTAPAVTANPQTAAAADTGPVPATGPTADPGPTANSEPCPDPGPAPDAGLRREWRAPFAVNIRLTLSVHRRGAGDPAYQVDAAGAVWRTSLTPDGPATLRVTSRQAGASPPFCGYSSYCPTYPTVQYSLTLPLQV